MTKSKKRAFTAAELELRHIVSRYLTEMHHEANKLHMRLLGISEAAARGYFYGFSHVSEDADVHAREQFGKKYPTFVELEEKLCGIHNGCLEAVTDALRGIAVGPTQQAAASNVSQEDD